MYLKKKKKRRLYSSTFPQSDLQTSVNQTDLTLVYLTLTLTLHLGRAGGPMVTKKPRVTTETAKLKTRLCTYRERSSLVMLNLV